MPRRENRAFSIRALPWYLVAAALLILAVGAQLDFATERDDYLAPRVPGPFASKVLAVRTDLALDAEASGPAMAQARQLVFARPVPAESLTRLARVAILEEEELLANEALIESARRGWRDPIAQVAILEGALLVDDWGVVAQRLSAMRKLRYPRELTDRRLATLAQHPEGRQELVRQFAADPFWLQQFAAYGPQIVPAETFVELVTSALGEIDEAQRCLSIVDATGALVAAHRGEEARQIWSPECGADRSGPATLALNAQSVGDTMSPFAWNYPTNPGLSRRVGRGENEVSVSFANNSKLKRVVAQKRAALPAGDYRLSMELAGQPRGARQRVSEIEPQILCTEIASPVRLRAQGNGTWSFSIPYQGCETQRVRIFVGVGKGEISNISLTRT